MGEHVLNSTEAKTLLSELSDITKHDKLELINEFCISLMEKSQGMSSNILDNNIDKFIDLGETMLLV